MFSRSAKVAVAVMSALAEAYGSDVRLPAADISRSRDLPRPFVGKVLSSLAGEGFVTSVRGPGGGFTLSRPPSKISLFDVVVLFDRSIVSQTCIVGGGLCSEGEPCPVHTEFSLARTATLEALQRTSFAVFQKVR